ncbi:hypothetical protein ACH5AO_36655 [Streptomyces sp. NPDC018964]|uniref:hypothetical protein n=1 Tax=unclassified Streptomyces TaxID=2593676 RepID=UPI0037A5FEC4
MQRTIHLLRAVGAGGVPEAVPAVRLRCPVAGCTTVWTGAVDSLAYAPTYDPYLDQHVHPCPWCAVEAPDAALEAHREVNDACRRDVSRWNEALGVP